MPASLSLDDAAVAPLVRKTAAWSWRLLVIAAAAWVLFDTLTRLGLVIVPVALALMLTALLIPAVDFLDRRGAPRGGAVTLVLICGLAAVGGILAFVITQFADGLPQLTDQVSQSIDSTRRWLIDGPLHLRPDQINHFGDTAIQTLRSHQQELTSGALSTAGTVTEIVTGALLALFTLIFLLLGGRNIWHFITQLAPAAVRQRVRDAGAAGFHSLTGYVRATSLVALVDAAGIGTGLAIMGIPLALPLASLVFLGAFIPLVGAVLSGFFAVVVALLAKGFVYALITLGLVIAIMQLEGHVLQPLVMGRAVSIHPLAVVLGISAGGVIAGIAGALLAVPTIAFFNSAVRVIRPVTRWRKRRNKRLGKLPSSKPSPTTLMNTRRSRCSPVTRNRVSQRSSRTGRDRGTHPSRCAARMQHGAAPSDRIGVRRIHGRLTGPRPAASPRGRPSPIGRGQPRAPSPASAALAALRPHTPRSFTSGGAGSQWPVGWTSSTSLR